mgnify:CR=1 FL=1
MSARAWRILDWLMPVLAMLAAEHGAQLVTTMESRGGWWGVGAGLLVVAARAVKQWYTERKRAR